MSQEDFNRGHQDGQKNGPSILDVGLDVAGGLEEMFSVGNCSSTSDYMRGKESGSKEWAKK